MPTPKSPRNPFSSVAHLSRLIRTQSQDGLALLQEPLDNPICAIHADDAVPCIVIVWRKVATSTQFRYIHEVLLQQIEAAGVARVLGDDTALAEIAPEDRQWLVDDWIPRAVAAGLRLGALKRPMADAARHVIDEMAAISPAGLKLRSFADLASARRWLREAG